jgi:hypothetical protein
MQPIDSHSGGYDVLSPGIVDVLEEPVSLLPASFWFICLAYSSTLKVEATCSSSVDFQRTIRRYIPQNITPQVYIMIGKKPVEISM